jgi:uncharacterized protein (UPF0332 family)
MSFDWNQYISLAEELNTGTPSEAKLRSAISRAYYGCFIQCRNKKGFSTEKDAGIHQRMIDNLKLSDIPIECSIGNLLAGLRVKRNEADYSSFLKITKQEVSLLINNAKRILNLLYSQDDQE